MSKFFGRSILATLLIFSSSCAWLKPHAAGPDARETEELMANSSTSQHDLETVAILGTNDIHGGLAPIELKTREADGAKPIEYQAGGAAYIASYVRILREKYGAHFLWLDGGDEFQGTIESNTERGAPMVQFFNLAGLSAAAVGNHEFDFGADEAHGKDVLTGTLQSRMSEARYPYVAANIIERATGRHAPFPNTQTRVMLQAGRLKVGVIGLSTLDTPTTTRAENVKGLEFEDLKTATLREAKALRDEGADLVVITSHVGIKCDRGRSSAGHTIRKPGDPQGECDEDDEMVRLLRSLPAGTVDGVVAGHSHQVVHHWVSGTPVIQAGSSGRYMNVMYLTYDWTEKKPVPERARIEGPLPVCPAVFQNQNDCNGDRPAPSNEKGGRGPLVTARFRGEKIGPDPAVQAMLAPVIQRTEAKKAEILAQAARPVEHNRQGESELGNLIADAMRAAARTDVAIMNPGGIRAPWEQGSITFGSVFRTLPFDNAVSKLTLTGKELKLLLRIVESGSRGFFPTSGLKLQVIDPAFDAPSSDLDGDKKIATWEINRLLDAKLVPEIGAEDDNGKDDAKESKPRAILDEKKYTVATIDFLVTGGDDLAWFMSQIPAERKVLSSGILARDSVVDYLKVHAKAGDAINDSESPLIDPDNRRLTLKKVERTGKKRSRKRRSKRK